MVVGVEFADVLDTNVGHYYYEQGINEFEDRALIFIPDPDQTLWLGTYNETYLTKDVKIYNENSRLVFRGRVANVPDWRTNSVVIVAEGYIAQFKDRSMTTFNTTEDPDSGQSRFTGYIWSESFTGLIASEAPNNILIQASADDAYFWVGVNWDNNETVIYAGTMVGGASARAYLRFPISLRDGSIVNSSYLVLPQVTVNGGTYTLRVYLIDDDNQAAFPDGAGAEPGLTATFVEWIPTNGENTIDITTLVQDYIDRAGYAEGQYMGIQINDNGVAAGKYIFQNSFDAGSNIAYIDIENLGELEDDSKAWGVDDYNDTYMCVVDIVETIPAAERWLSIDWQTSPITLAIQAIADDASWNSNSEAYDNNTTAIACGWIQAAPDYHSNFYGRFSINIPNGCTVSECLFYIYVTSDHAANDFTLTLIDENNCDAFPDGLAAERDMTATTKTMSAPTAIGWMSVDIVDLLQAYIDRNGYIPTQYMGVRIKSAYSNGSDNYFGMNMFDNGSNIPYLLISYTPNPPDKIQYKIKDTEATVLYLEDFSLTGLIIGNPFIICKQTSVLANDKALEYDLDEMVTPSTSESHIGLVKEFGYGTNTYDVFRSCLNADGFILRLKNDLILIYKPIADITSSGSLTEDILDLQAITQPSVLINLVKVRNKYGEEVIRAWNYDNDVAVDDTIVSNPYIQREKYITAPDWGDRTICKEIADAVLKKHADPQPKDNIELVMKGDPEISTVVVEAGLKVTFTYNAQTYTDYLITRKKYDSKMDKTTLKLVKYL